jgi:hypothetical protein
MKFCVREHDRRLILASRDRPMDFGKHGRTVLARDSALSLH